MYIKMERVCKICGVEKDINDFYVRKTLYKDTEYLNIDKCCKKCYIKKVNSNNDYNKDKNDNKYSNKIYSDDYYLFRKLNKDQSSEFYNFNNYIKFLIKKYDLWKK